jgi:transglutaminase-like putative cysteine protease
MPEYSHIASVSARLLLAGAMALVSVPSPAANLFGSHSKDFGKDKQDIPQWGLDAAKTPTPDYVKDAEAVVLYDEYVETVDDQGRAVERERRVKRILKPQGRSVSCNVSYNEDEKINYFRAWTIAAEGKQYQARENDFVEEGDTGIPVMLSTRKFVIAHPPAEDVGATLVCESEEVLAPYFHEAVWQFQSGLPMVYQALEVDLPPGRAHTESWHRTAPVKPVEVAPNHWRWEMKDMRALDLREVRATLEWEALAARMSVLWGDAAVEGKEKQWKALGQYFTDLEEHRPDPSPEITARTQELVAGAPDFYSKLRNITEFIQKNVRYFIVERGIGGWQANHATDIFRNKYGDCKDKTTILISMLQAAGIHAVYMPVDTHRGYVDPDAPSLYGNHMITAIEVPGDVKDTRLKALVTAKDGKRYLIFDPTNEHTPVGNLPYYLQGSYGILAAGTASQIIALPVLTPDANLTTQTGSFTLTADGTLSGTVDSFHEGTYGADLRWLIKYSDEKERREYWEKRVAETLPGVTLDSFTFIQPANLDKPLEFHYKVTAKQYAHQAGPLLLVRPRVLGSHVRPLDDKPRVYPIDLSATGSWKDSFDIALPAGYAVDELPDPVDVNLDFASYHSTVKAEAGHLHYEREYQVRKVEIPASRAAEYRKLQGAILFDEKGSAVLKKQ